jgi:adenylosuccinate lyase
MLAKTHGQVFFSPQQHLLLITCYAQPATPTRLGKEFLVWVERLNAQVKHLHQVPFTAKFSGATGGLNAHHVRNNSFKEKKQTREM